MKLFSLVLGHVQLRQYEYEVQRAFVGLAALREIPVPIYQYCRLLACRFLLFLVLFFVLFSWCWLATRLTFEGGCKVFARNIFDLSFFFCFLALSFSFKCSLNL